MKRKNMLVAFFLTAGLWGASGALFAHHSAAGLFSPDVEKTITGTVTKWMFVNPHPAIVMDVKNDQGVVETWRIQFPNPAGLTRRFGWNRNSIKPGDEVILRVDDGELRISTLRSRLERARRHVRKYVKPGVSLVDELIAERREEAKRE